MLPAASELLLLVVPKPKTSREDAGLPALETDSATEIFSNNLKSQSVNFKLEILSLLSVSSLLIHFITVTVIVSTGKNLLTNANCGLLQ